MQKKTCDVCRRDIEKIITGCLSTYGNYILLGYGHRAVYRWWNCNADKSVWSRQTARLRLTYWARRGDRCTWRIGSAMLFLYWTWRIGCMPTSAPLHRSTVEHVAVEWRAWHTEQKPRSEQKQRVQPLQQWSSSCSSVQLNV